ncbi:hypothetical protein [uncultured Arthrobacter sp.]|uniref:hypothetical protein n=1 Tax=uncultured Arthrobacter sp. TaxID=114050 RepID=UPI002601D4DA|nr:hypothetical protein [uncultured Arthrobacter sp.]
MTEQRQYDGGAGTAQSSPVQQSGRSETPADSSASSGHPGQAGHTGPEAVAGPFTLRETVIGVSVLVMFVGTILPFVDGVNLWRTFSLFFLGIGILLPVAALALLVGRRQGAKSLRVGSLSVDQFASVTAAFAAAFFFLQTVTTFEIGSLIALIGSMGFLVATVGGPHIGVFKPDFAGRPSSSAHPIAREALPAKPRPPKPVPAEKVSGWTDLHSSGAPAASGPSSAGHSAGFAVAGYAAGQGGGVPQAPSAGQDQARQSASAPVAAENREVKPAATGATAAQPDSAQTAGAQAETKADSLADPDRPTDSAAVAPTSAAAPASEAAAEPASEAAAAAGSAGPVASAESAAPAPTAAQPSVGETPDRTAAHPVVQRHPETAEQQASQPRTESISATRDAEDDEPMLEAFWFAVGTPRSVVDEQTGAPLFVLQPGDWEVGIEDRGHEFLVQDKRTGRVGVMRDLRNIERAPTEG